MRDSDGMDGFTVVYGGSFNPPHMGHQMACLYLLEALGAGAVWLLPTVHHPFGKNLAPFSHRVKMCQLMAHLFGNRVVVSEVEATPGTSGRTYDTLTRLHSENPGQRFALAVGSDILGETSLWHRWDDIVSMVPVIVMGRGGYPHEQAGPVELPPISSGDIRKRIHSGQGIDGLVPARITEYIERHGLYR
ncbi:nicotinate (nicotinamide) nucleotide adenylyltransferase [Myxococcota bacterium]